MSEREKEGIPVESLVVWNDAVYSISMDGKVPTYDLPNGLNMYSQEESLHGISETIRFFQPVPGKDITIYPDNSDPALDNVMLFDDKHQPIEKISAPVSVEALGNQLPHFVQLVEDTQVIEGLEMCLPSNMDEISLRFFEQEMNKGVFPEKDAKKVVYAHVLDSLPAMYLNLTVGKFYFESRNLPFDFHFGRNGIGVEKDGSLIQKMFCNTEWTTVRAHEQDDTDEIQVRQFRNKNTGFFECLVDTVRISQEGTYGDIEVPSDKQLMIIAGFKYKIPVGPLAIQRIVENINDLEYFDPAWMDLLYAQVRPYARVELANQASLHLT